MAYISKTVSCKEVILEVERTFKPQGSSWIKEAIEDIGWAIQHIGYHAGFEKLSSPFPYLTVKNNRAKIPCNVERIIAVEQLLPGIGNTQNILNPDGTTPAPVVPSEDQLKCGDFQSCRLALGSDLSGYGLVDEDSPRTTRPLPNAPYYNVNTDYIITSFTDGLIKLHFVGFAVDKSGYPKILDDADYKMACKWYIFGNMMLKGYKNPNLSYKDVVALYDKHRLAAENAPKMPSLDGADRFRAGWSRYIQNSEVSKDYFMNNEQTAYIDE